MAGAVIIAFAYRRWRVPALRILVERMRPGPEGALAGAAAVALRAGRVRGS